MTFSKGAASSPGEGVTPHWPDSNSLYPTSCPQRREAPESPHFLLQLSLLPRSFSPGPFAGPVLLGPCHLAGLGVAKASPGCARRFLRGQGPAAHSRPALPRAPPRS